MSNTSNSNLFLADMEWDVTRLKFLTNWIQTGATPSTSNEGYFNGNVFWYTPGDYNEHSYLGNSNRTISKLAVLDNEAKIFPKDTVAIVGIGATLGKVALLPESASFNQQITGIKTNHLLEPEFLYYWLFINRETIIKTANYTTLPIINNQFLKEFNCPVPSIRTQREIVGFLNHKSKTIFKTIGYKEKLIELLEEKRQAMITEAVTKGLNANVKMKDSGVEWIGEIPEHWEVSKIKYKFEIKKIIEPRKELTVLSLTQKGLKIKNLKDFSGQHAESYEKYQRVDIYDYVMNGMDLLTGYVDCSRFEGVTSPDYRVYRLKDIDECHGYYLRYFQMCYFAKIFYGHGQGVSNLGRWRLQTSVFKDFPIPVAPVAEQIEVKEFLEQQETEINRFIELNQDQIKELKEYRQSLIYEAVTGKIDVRNFEVEQ